MEIGRNAQIKYTQLFINNEFVPSQSGKTFKTFNPCNGLKIAEIAEADKADVDIAVKAAREAFKPGSPWRLLDASARGRLLNKFADLVQRDLAHLASLETLDNGKPYGEALGSMHGAVASLRYYAGWADKVHGDTIPADGGHLTFTRKEPIGVVGSIVPWNFPTLMAAWKLAPALATGCTVVLKPAELSPLTALHLAALIKEAGFPHGVVNVVPGFGNTAGAALTNHPDVNKIAFTGSTAVGKIVSTAAAQSNLKRVTLELGGKNPIVVCADADLAMAAETAHNAIFSNQGQVCCAASRTFVAEEIYDKFVAKSVQLAQNRVLGNPFDPNVVQGPQIDQNQLNKIKELVETGIKEGAKLEFGGKQWGNVGYYYQPTVLSNLNDQMTISRKEIFGPVQQIYKFKTLEEAIQRANNSCYGLSAGIITKNLDNVMKFTNEIQAGTVWVNTYLRILPQAPFGGFKESGIGRENGKEGLDGYLEMKTITIKL